VSAALLALGVSHKTAPVALRERLALPEGRAAGALHELAGDPSIHEAVAISTCNRTELHLVAGDPVEAESIALTALSRQAGIRPTELFGRIYSLRGSDAARHLFEVAAGLDSMIVGEAEVQGQVKRAYELALVEGVTGPISNQLFRDALAAGKRVRTETALGRGRTSVSSVAVDLARAALGELSTRRVLVLGAGENGELTARALSERGVTTVFIANRRYDRAIGLAQRFGGKAVRFDDLPEELVAADIVVSSTGSPHQILGHEELAMVVEHREGRPLLLIDIAVPRDIDPSVRNLPGLTLYDMDDLQREVARNLGVREAESTRARAIVDEEVGRFERWLAGLDVVPTIAALRERGEAIVDLVVGENEPRFESLSEADRERIHAMARAIVGRLLHEPTLRLKRSAGGDPSYVYVQALRELFGLDPEERADELRRMEARIRAGDEPPRDAGEDSAARVTPIDSRRAGAGSDASRGRARSRDASDRRRP
jgi:glutamyl-tRNA reductase